MNGSPTRVVHVAPGHVALDTRVFHKEARTLAEHGYEVTVIGQHHGVEVVEGIRIVGLPKPSGRFDRFVLGQFRLLARCASAGGDVYHLHDFDAIPAGLVMRVRGRRLIYDSHEDYPRLVMSRSWIPSRLRKVVRLGVRVVEAVVTRFADAVISAEEEGARRFPAAKTTVVRNYVLDSEFEALEPAEKSTTVARVVYVGAMTRERGIVELVRALPEMAGDRAVELVLLGDLADLRAELEALPAWSRVRAPGFASRSDVVHELRHADVAALLWHPTPKHAEGAVPVKLFEYMAAGLPVVASDLPLIRTVLASLQCGVLVDHRDLSAVGRAIQELGDDPARARTLGTRGRQAVGRRYLWSGEAGRLTALYAHLICCQPMGGHSP